ERMRGRANAFLNERNWSQLLKDLPSVLDLRNAALRINDRAGERDRQRAAVEYQDLVTKSFVLNDDKLIPAITQAYENRLEKETDHLRRFTDLQQVANATNDLLDEVRKTSTELLRDVAPTLMDAARQAAE